MSYRRSGPRLPALTLPDAKQPFLLLEGKKYTLRNLSEEGIGLWVLPPLPFGMSPGTLFSADLTVESKVFPVQLELVHYSPRIIGLRFVRLPAELSAILSELLKPALYGSELVAHEMNLALDPLEGLPRLWFQSKIGSELMVWYQENLRTILALQLCWLGKWVYRKQMKNVKTGYLRDGWGMGQGRVMDSADLLMRHRKADQRVLQEASQLLSTLMPPLPGLKLWQFLEMGEQVALPPESVTPKKAA